MSMSTNIADLPGPTPDDMEDQYQQQEQQMYEEEDFYEQPESVQMKIRKVHEVENFEENSENSSGIFELLRKEICEENLLILVFLFVATTPQADDYTRKFLSMLPFSIPTSPFSQTTFKCVLLLLLMVLIKNYFLSYIRV